MKLILSGDNNNYCFIDGRYNIQGYYQVKGFLDCYIISSGRIIGYINRYGNNGFSV